MQGIHCPAFHLVLRPVLLPFSFYETAAGSEAAHSYRDLLAHKLREKSKAGVEAVRAAFSFSGLGGEGQGTPSSSGAHCCMARDVCKVYMV
jgi:hypothetical protein